MKSKISIRGRIEHIKLIFRDVLYNYKKAVASLEQISNSLSEISKTQTERKLSTMIAPTWFNQKVIDYVLDNVKDNTEEVYDSVLFQVHQKFGRDLREAVSNGASYDEIFSYVVLIVEEHVQWINTK